MLVSSGTVTPLSMIAFLITQLRPTSTPSSSTLSSIVVPLWMWQRGDSTELVTVAPEMTTPGETAELCASPNLPIAPWTSFAGGNGP